MVILSELMRKPIRCGRITRRRRGRGSSTLEVPMPRLIAIACATLFALGSAILPGVADALPDSIRERMELATGINLQTSRGILTIEPRQDGIIHVRFGTPGYAGNYNPAVIAQSQSVSYHTAESRDAYTLATKHLVVRINKADATI